MSQGKTLKRVGFELFVLVAGILIAFWLDAWWDRASARDAELSELAGIRAELAEGVGVLTTFLDIQSAYGRHLDNLILELRAGVRRVPLPDSTLRALVAWRTVDFPSASMDALVGSGRLGSVRDLEVRAALASFPAVLDDLREDEDLARDWVEMVLVPYLAPSGILPDAYENHPMTRSLSGETGMTGVALEITGSAELLGLVSARRMHVRASEWGLRNAIGRAEDLLSLLDDEIR